MRCLPNTKCKQVILPSQEKEDTMLLTIGIILLVLWLLGIVTSYTMGGFIHILLVIAVVVILVRIIRGDKIL